MENIVEFPDRELIEQEAAEWLVRLDGDIALAAIEMESLREWMQRSPAHSAELTSLAEFWGDQSLVALSIPLERLSYVQEGEKTSHSWFSLSRWGEWSTWGAFATASLVVAFVTLLTANAGLQAWFNGTDASSALYASAVGEQRSIKLPDGSSVYLNTNSQVKIDYGEGYRNIQLLQGEAHFDVVKQKQRPFRVYAGRGRVQAVGTAFTVFIREGRELDVAVTEGIVALAMLDKDSTNKGASNVDKEVVDNSPPSSQVESGNSSAHSSTEYYLEIPVNDLGVLEAGQETTLLVAQQSQAGSQDNILNIQQVAEEELARRGAWRKGLLIFSGDSLEHVVKEVSRYTTLSIEIVDPELKQVRIGGRFSVNSTSEFFNALEANFGLRVMQLDYNRVEISSIEKNITAKNK